MSAKYSMRFSLFAAVLFLTSNAHADRLLSTVDANWLHYSADPADFDLYFGINGGEESHPDMVTLEIEGVSAADYGHAFTFSAADPGFADVAKMIHQSEFGASFYVDQYGFYCATNSLWQSSSDLFSTTTSPLSGHLGGIQLTSIAVTPLDLHHAQFDFYGVPEPSTWLLLTIGVGFCVLRKVPLLSRR